MKLINKNLESNLFCKLTQDADKAHALHPDYCADEKFFMQKVVCFLEDSFILFKILQMKDHIRQKIHDL